MDEIDLSAIDLNLLVALAALVETRSVTRAARRLRVTQSTMSHTLARLRVLLGDPVLVRAGRGMELTPRAQAVASPLGRTLAEITRLLAAEPDFDPATSTRTFSLACLDLLAPFVPDLLARMRAEAPRVTLDLRVPERGDIAQALLQGENDLAMAPPQPTTSGLMQRALGTVHWEVFGRAGHPALRPPRLTRKAYLDHPHAVVRLGNGGRGIVGDALATAGLDRKVGLVVPGFMLAPAAVARSDLLLTAPAQPMAPLAVALGLARRKPPIAIPQVPVVLYWPERLHGDAGHRWFRGCVGEVITGILRAR
jgi:DNA-binding transcriptional LysR family regulator